MTTTKRYFDIEVRRVLGSYKVQHLVGFFLEAKDESRCMKMFTYYAHKN